MKATSHFLALRTIFFEELQVAMAVTVRCSSFYAAGFLWWLLMRLTSSVKSAAFTVSGATDFK